MHSGKIGTSLCTIPNEFMSIRHRTLRGVGRQTGHVRRTRRLAPKMNRSLHEEFIRAGRGPSAQIPATLTLGDHDARVA